MRHIFDRRTMNLPVIALILGYICIMLSAITRGFTRHSACSKSHEDGAGADNPIRRSGSCIDSRKAQIVKDRRRRPSLFLNHRGGGSFWFRCPVVMEIFESRILISYRATADIWGQLEQPASGNLTIFNALCECWTKLMVTDLSARIHYTAH